MTFVQKNDYDIFYFSTGNSQKLQCTNLSLEKSTFDCFDHASSYYCFLNLNQKRPLLYSVRLLNFSKSNIQVIKLRSESYTIQSNRSSGPRVISPEVMSPEILIMSPEETNTKKIRISGCKQAITLRNFLSLKRSLFPTTP